MTVKCERTSVLYNKTSNVRFEHLTNLFNKSKLSTSSAIQYIELKHTSSNGTQKENIVLVLDAKYLLGKITNNRNSCYLRIDTDVLQYIIDSFVEMMMIK